MSRADIESLTEVKLHRQQIREQMENLHRQRMLVEKLEQDGKDTKAARQSLREMLTTLESVLDDHNRMVEPNSK
jgi:hypothetical protein